jgi:uncharacterized protein involved in exopolysaccharide biosynthesis
MYAVASGFDDAPYANPQRTVLQVSPNRKKIDAEISGKIYGNIVQQLEMSRTNLQKLTPLIQIIDAPVLPLATSGVSPVTATTVGLFICLFLSIVWFAVRFQLKKMIK